jgi:hypothetical protein
MSEEERHHERNSIDRPVLSGSHTMSQEAEQSPQSGLFLEGRSLRVLRI